MATDTLPTTIKALLDDCRSIGESLIILRNLQCLDPLWNLRSHVSVFWAYIFSHLDLSKPTNPRCHFSNLGFFKIEKDYVFTGHSWSYYRLIYEEESKDLKAYANDSSIISHKADDFATSTNYLAILYSNTVYVFKGRLDIPCVEITCDQQIECTIIIEAREGVIILMFDDKGDCNSYRILSHSYEGPFECIPEGYYYGYDGYYSEGSIVSYTDINKIKSISLYPDLENLLSNDELALVRCNNSARIDEITMRNSIVLYDTVNTKILRTVKNEAMAIGSMLVFPNGIYDIMTGERLLSTKKRGIVTSMTKKDDDSGYIVWIYEHQKH